MKTLTVIHASRIALGATLLSLSLLTPVSGHAVVSKFDVNKTPSFHITSCLAQPPGSCVTACASSTTKSKAAMCLQSCGTAAKGCMVVE